MLPFTQSLIIANGELPAEKVIKDLLAEPHFILCADGGANAALVWHISPHCIIGDLDSLLPDTRQAFPEAILIQNPDQNTTDLEKAILYLIAQKISHVRIAGATGKRTDHTLSNLCLLAKYQGKLDLRFIDDYGEIWAIRGENVLDLPVGQTISLLPLGSAEGVSTTGLQYEMKDDQLISGLHESQSNCVVNSPVRIDIGKGFLLIFALRQTC